ncbi:hypothetical protein [Segniliparus rugosus]|uniref:Secreted protein n=1 Tax=Segniliparus rugosus (strain ATCC BAA-974 / DSM 45345 / CCUG 50838 / CIP 108380 / JCM 13579 / CDC 945) TaxID=679197 RepID=E5XPI6_SEGRC|nr:hypothetical protein [Segniliparus rugosus]EFV13749.2 hypothetical protein HMPREF9336_01408 [Segniliparus rugosus ATCC BAA-974]
MTLLWFSLAVVTALLGVGLVVLDKRIYPSAAQGSQNSEKVAAGAGKVHVSPARASAWGEPARERQEPPRPAQVAAAEAPPQPAVAPAPVQQQPAVPAPAEQQPPPPLPVEAQSPQPAVAPAPVQQQPAAPALPQLPAELPSAGASTIHYESHVHNYNAPVYNGPVYNGPVYIENAHVEEAPAETSGRRKGFFDRLVKAERQKRQQWASERNFQYESSDSALVHRWRRGVFAARQAKAARAIVRAETDIGILEFFDVDDLVAIAALHTEHPSSVRIELRAGWAGPPVLADVTRVGELGGYEVHASDVGAGQRFLWDPRLEGFIARLPQFVRVLWNEGPWVLAELPLDIPDSDLDSAAVVVRELADLLRVLPPELDPEPVDRQGFDPGAPQGQLPRWAGQA